MALAELLQILGCLPETSFVCHQQESMPALTSRKPDCVFHPRLSWLPANLVFFCLSVQMLEHIGKLALYTASLHEWSSLSQIISRCPACGLPAVRDQLGLVRVQELLTGRTLSVSSHVNAFSKEVGKKSFCLGSCPYNTSVWGFDTCSQFRISGTESSAHIVHIWCVHRCLSLCPAQIS